MTKDVSGQLKDEAQDVTAIITAMTNDERAFVSETVESVLADPYIAQVILCIEDKNDWIDSIIESHLKDLRLHIVRIPLMPIGAVRNRALQYVQKPWLAYCDGDDVWCNGKTKIQQEYARKTGADLVGAGHYLTDEKGNVRAYGLSLFIPMPSSWLVRTDLMRQYPFNEFRTRGSDGEWWISIPARIRKVKCPEMLVRYRVRTYSVSSIAFSKRRKLQLVALAGIPVLGPVIRFLTYCFWILTRHQSYRWMPRWSKWLKQYQH